MRANSGREAFSLFMSAAQDGHVEAMYHLATFPDFTSEPFRSPLSDEETWQWLLRAAESMSRRMSGVRRHASTSDARATGQYWPYVRTRQVSHPVDPGTSPSFVLASWTLGRRIRER
jgi:TPR repeat protein